MPHKRHDRVLPRKVLEGPLCDSVEVEAFLVAFGDHDDPLPETVKVLDEIVTDYIIETCHEAASVATHARRAKIKLDDFKFMLRRDTAKLGRVSEMLDIDKKLKKDRKAFETDEGTVAKENEKDDKAGEDGVGGGKGGPGAKGGAKSDAGTVAGSKRGGDGIGADGEKKKKKRKKNKDGDGRDDTSTVRSG